MFKQPNFNKVLVLDTNRKPLMPCYPARARKLLEKGRASVFRRYPFTIILYDRTVEESELQDIEIKIDQGSKTTGMAFQELVPNHEARISLVLRLEMWLKLLSQKVLGLRYLLELI